MENERVIMRKEERKNGRIKKRGRKREKMKRKS